MVSPCTIPQPLRGLRSPWRWSRSLPACCPRGARLESIPWWHCDTSEEKADENNDWPITRSSLRFAPVVQETRVHGGCHSYSRARHGVEHGGLQHRQYDFAEAFALPPSRKDRNSVAHCASGYESWRGRVSLGRTRFQILFAGIENLPGDGGV